MSGASWLQCQCRLQHRSGSGATAAADLHAAQLQPLTPSRSCALRYAINQCYNVCSDRCITLNGIAKAVGKALGKEPKIVNYPVSGSKAEGFPFRYGSER